MNIPRRFMLAVCAALSVLPGSAAKIVFGTFEASLNTGSLAGVTFPVTYSYDASLLLPTGQSYITLSSLDFNLLGTELRRSDISQGGQVIADNGVIDNLTASFQGVLPSGARFENVTFGFGGPGIIGYIDLAGNYGSGFFSLTAAPEPGYRFLLIVGLAVMVRRRSTPMQSRPTQTESEQ